MYRKPDAPQLIGGVLDNGFVLFKASFKSVVLPAGLGAVAWSVPTLLSNPFTFIEAFTGDAQVADPAESLALLPVMLLSSLVGGYFYLATLTRTVAFAEGESLDFVATLRRAAGRLPAVVGYIVILAGAALASVLAGLILLLPLAAAAGGSAMLIGVVALVPLGVVIIYWYFAVFIIVMERNGPWVAVRRSCLLVRGHWWRTLVIVTVTYFVYFAAVALAGLVGLALGNVAGFTDLNIRVVTYVAEVGTNLATTPFMLAMSLAILYDLQLRRSGSDLAARINAMADEGAMSG